MPTKCVLLQILHAEPTLEFIMGIIECSYWYFNIPYAPDGVGFAFYRAQESGDACGFQWD